MTKKAKAFVTDEELARLLKTCSGATFANRRDIAIMRIFIDTGLPVSGLAGLRYDPDDESANDVFLAQRRLRIRLNGGATALCAFPAMPPRPSLDPGLFRLDPADQILPADRLQQRRMVGSHVTSDHPDHLVIAIAAGHETAFAPDQLHPRASYSGCMPSVMPGCWRDLGALAPGADPDLRGAGH